MKEAGKILLAKKEKEVFLLPQMANRHGLIAGATGTGKTITLQVLAESFSFLGVPVFSVDVKGDLAGLCISGEGNPHVEKRVKELGLEGFNYSAFPVAFWDVFAEQGHPVRTTISEMGPLLLGRLLNLNDTQSGILNIVFKIADDLGMLLTLDQTILKNDLEIKTSYTPGTIIATDGTKLAACSDLGVTNNSKITFGPILSLKLDEGSGTIAYDSSGYGNNGFLNGNAHWGEGIQRKRLKPYRNRQLFSYTKANLNNLSDWTFEAWVKPETSGYIYTEGNPEVTMIIALTENNGIKISTWHASRPGWAHYTTAPNIITTNKWNHLVVTLADAGSAVDSGTVTCYINGQPVVPSGDLGSVSDATTREAELGRNVGSKIGQESHTLKADLDEVTIYSRILSPEEIQQNYRKIVFLENIKITNQHNQETTRDCVLGTDSINKIEFDLNKPVNKLILGLNLPSNIKAIQIINTFKDKAQIIDGNKIMIEQPLTAGHHEIELVLRLEHKLDVKTKYYGDDKGVITNDESGLFEFQVVDLPDIL